ncbi:MAG: ABC transporter permease [Atopobiaceae bacterium]|nr:ABC transporter permease [Atopobiaceae bacterium]
MTGLSQPATDTTVEHSQEQSAWYPTSKRDRSIIAQLVSKDFKLRYRRSVLGVAWSVLNPLLMMIVMAAVFSSFMRYNDPSIGNYPLYLIVGNTLFNLVSEATNGGMGSIVTAASLLKKIKINRYVFPVQKVLSAVVNYLFSLIAVAIVMIFFQIPPSPVILLLPIPLLMVTVFCIGLSLLLAAAAVFFRDVMHLWGVVMTAWLYATPIFYPITILPDWLAAFENFNPMYLFITYFRDLLLWQQMPTLSLNIRCLIISLASLAIGIFVFHKNERKFILYI